MAQRSTVLKGAFRLTRRRGKLGRWTYDLLEKRA
jgi:hypothetical protein